jgi:hypothetical protein
MVRQLEVADTSCLTVPFLAQLAQKTDENSVISWAPRAVPR